MVPHDLETGHHDIVAVKTPTDNIYSQPIEYAWLPTVASLPRNW